MKPYVCGQNSGCSEKLRPPHAMPNSRLRQPGRPVCHVHRHYRESCHPQWPLQHGDTPGRPGHLWPGRQAAGGHHLTDRGQGDDGEVDGPAGHTDSGDDVLRQTQEDSAGQQETGPDGQVRDVRLDVQEQADEAVQIQGRGDTEPQVLREMMGRPAQDEDRQGQARQVQQRGRERCCRRGRGGHGILHCLCREAEHRQPYR